MFLYLKTLFTYCFQSVLDNFQSLDWFKNFRIMYTNILEIKMYKKIPILFFKFKKINTQD
jgi:hypothetical protein